jgi:hypothetical protein
MDEQNPQFAKSIRSKILEDDTKLPEFPEFYAIPKFTRIPQDTNLSSHVITTSLNLQVKL